MICRIPTVLVDRSVGLLVGFNMGLGRARNGLLMLIDLVILTQAGLENL